MEIRDRLAQVQQSQTFKEWHAGMPQAFLSSLFVLIDGERQDWQAGFYDPLSERTATFLIGDPITLIPPSPTFKEPNAQVRALDLGTVTVDLGECLAVVAERQRQEFPHAVPSKIIVILQHLPLGQVYNVTYVTPALSTLNIKVDAATREVREAKLIPIISFPGK